MVSKLKYIATRSITDNCDRHINSDDEVMMTILDDDVTVMSQYSNLLTSIAVVTTSLELPVVSK
jgi:hypothetical protein